MGGNVKVVYWMFNRNYIVCIWGVVFKVKVVF